MQRLTGQDAGFLYNETPSQHMHTLKIAVLDPSTIPGGYSFERVKEVLSERLHLLPPFRRRLLPVPFDLHHPLWIEDPDFDIDFHVQRTALPAPGRREQFDELISQIASHPLDRSRALWEVWVVEGLEGGSIGFVAKIHHCAADGVMAADLLSNVFDTDPEQLDAPPPERPWRPDPIPSKVRLVLAALLDLAKVVLGLPALAVRTGRGMVAVRRHKRSAAVSPPAPFSGPKCSFNRSLTPHRRFVSMSLPLADVKEVKTRFGVTLNDVVLALCAGALRGYLDERGELPSKPLVAGVPISTRMPGKPLRANSVSNMFTTIPVDVADPVQRVSAVHEVTKGAKEQFNLLGVDMLADWSELTPPRPYAAFIRLYGRLRLADRHRPPINMVISNVPGPPIPLYIAGARLEAIYSMGPILENIGLNITMWSYLDSLNFGIVAVREHLPDLPRLAHYLEEELDT
ncbi:MAG: diacylglycerol O-acyltransferase / wax synthase, partial [Acidimicrobiaceae bacterium]|nr:diacylglycerol O-acyltransferase / wax synthase [Acidimicrobiaceae bacterium]